MKRREVKVIVGTIDSKDLRNPNSQSETSSAREISRKTLGQNDVLTSHWRKIKT